MKNINRAPIFVILLIANGCTSITESPRFREKRNSQSRTNNSSVQMGGLAVPATATKVDSSLSIEIECEEDLDCSALTNMRPWQSGRFSHTEQIWCDRERSKCIECNTDEDCTLDEVCTERKGCHPKARCSQNHDCGGKAIHDACINGMCTPCQTDSDCGSNERCLTRPIAVASAELASLSQFRCVNLDRIDASCLDWTCKTVCERVAEDPIDDITREPTPGIRCFVPENVIK